MLPPFERKMTPLAEKVMRNEMQRYHKHKKQGGKKVASAFREKVKNFEATGKVWEQKLRARLG